MPQKQLKKLDEIQPKRPEYAEDQHTDAVRVYMAEMPLDSRREKLPLMYWVNLKGCNQKHGTCTVLNECWEYKRTEEIVLGGNISSGSGNVAWKIMAL